MRTRGWYPNNMLQMTDLVDKLMAKLAGWIEGLIVMLPNLLLAAFVVLLFAVGSRWVESMVRQLLQRVSGNVPISQLMGRVSRVSVVLLGAFFALSLLRLEKTVTSLLAGVGVVGLALGFAFQEIAANFISGFMMALNRPFDVGDLVEVGGHRGRIRDIAFRATTLETLDGLSILIPNKDVYQNPIVNYTQTPLRRLELSVGTAYCDDMAHVKSTIEQALAELPQRRKSEPVQVLFHEFGDSSINSHVLVWLQQSDEASFRKARSEAMIAIKSAFDREGITIPFPIRTLDFGAAVVGGSRLDQLQWTGREGLALARGMRSENGGEEPAES